ncbi:ABC1-domain-containing protein [Serendipita vermifera]|nr:ABC1-domain-containing protein [Serendipita vermifera]
MLTLDYKLNYDPNNLDKMNGVHERSAARLLHVCRKNGGLYVKAGQAIGIQAAILPKPYHALAQMFDAADPIPLEAVRQVIHAELGMWPEEIFAEFDPNPIGSASIAQVHRAKLHTGEEVAVKVQRPDIRKHAKWDMLAFRILMRIYESVFDLPLSFASQYISDQIQLETRFDHELSNTKRIRDHVLNQSPRNIRGVAYVPAVYESFSTPRLLVMEYIEGAVRMTDVDALQNRLGLDVNKVMNSVCEVFAAQVFRWGFVNADPHPSNVLIRRHPSNPKTHQVVLLDHGLSIPLPPKFRMEYLQLWKSIFTNDLPTMHAVCKGWGVDLGEDGLGAQMLGSTVLLQNWSGSSRRSGRGDQKGRRGGKGAGKDSTGEKRKMSDEQRKKRDLERQRAMKATVKRFLQNYELIPKELIFLGRGMRITQANNQVLGSPVDRISILAKGACDSLYEMTMHPPESLRQVTFPSNLIQPVNNSSPWLRSYLKANADWFQFRLAIAGMNVAFGSHGVFWGILWLQEIWSTAIMRLGIAKRDVEEPKNEEGDLDMQQEVMEMAKELGVEIDESVFRG